MHNFKNLLLFFLINGIALTPLYAQSRKKLLSLKDTLDRKFDMSEYIVDANGFVPIPYILTEPAFGGFGGALAPGIEISVDALAARAARLLKVELVRPRSVIGKSTVEALQSGIIFGFAGQIDGIVRRIAAELDTDPVVLATGGLAPLVLEESETIAYHEPDLTLIGLRLVFERNAV